MQNLVQKWRELAPLFFLAPLPLRHYFLLQRHRDVRHLFQFAPVARWRLKWRKCPTLRVARHVASALVVSFPISIRYSLHI